MNKIIELLTDATKTNKVIWKLISYKRKYTNQEIYITKHFRVRKSNIPGITTRALEYRRHWWNSFIQINTELPEFIKLIEEIRNQFANNVFNIK